MVTYIQTTDYAAMWTEARDCDAEADSINPHAANRQLVKRYNMLRARANLLRGLDAEQHRMRLACYAAANALEAADAGGLEDSDPDAYRALRQALQAAEATLREFDPRNSYFS